MATQAKAGKRAAGVGPLAVGWGLTAATIAGLAGWLYLEGRKGETGIAVPRIVAALPDPAEPAPAAAAPAQPEPPAGAHASEAAPQPPAPPPAGALPAAIPVIATSAATAPVTPLRAEDAAPGTVAPPQAEAKPTEAEPAETERPEPVAAEAPAPPGGGEAPPAKAGAPPPAASAKAAAPREARPSVPAKEGKAAAPEKAVAAPVEVEKAPPAAAAPAPEEGREPAAQPAEKASPAPAPEPKLAPAPDPALVEAGRQGPLPTVSPDGREPWRVYARPFDETDRRPRIAVVIGELGLSGAATETAIQQLPGSVTLGFSPYSKNLEHWIPLARAAGHEVILSLPMEPVDYPAQDPGPYTLLTAIDAKQNLFKMEWLLSRATGYVGVTNYLGSRFTTSSRDLRPILEAVKARGLMFVDSRSSEKSLAVTIAHELRLPWAYSNRVIDAEASRDAIDGELRHVEAVAKAEGFALAMGAAYPVTIERVAVWLPEAAARGFAIAPVSALANKQKPP